MASARVTESPRPTRPKAPHGKRSASEVTNSTDYLLNLQRTAGNRAVAGLVENQPLSLQRLTDPETFAQQAKLFLRKGKSADEIRHFAVRLKWWKAYENDSPQDRQEFLDAFRQELTAWLAQKGTDSSRRPLVQRLLRDVERETMKIEQEISASEEEAEGSPAAKDVEAGGDDAYSASLYKANKSTGPKPSPNSSEGSMDDPYAASLYSANKRPAQTPEEARRVKAAQASQAYDAPSGQVEGSQLPPSDAQGWIARLEGVDGVVGLKSQWARFVGAGTDSDEAFVRVAEAAAKKGAELAEWGFAANRYRQCYEKASDSHVKLGYAGMAGKCYLDADSASLEDAVKLLRQAMSLVDVVHPEPKDAKSTPASPRAEKAGGMSLPVHPGYESESQYSGTWKLKLTNLFGDVDSMLRQGDMPSPEVVSANIEASGIWPLLLGQSEPKVKYLNADERENYRVEADESGFRRATTAEPYDTAEESTAFSGKGYAIFVISNDDRLYANSHRVSQFHHSSFTAGSDVKSAGELKVDPNGDEGGKLVRITNKSGHYQPSTEHLVLTLTMLSTQWGIDLSDAEVSDMNENALRPVWHNGNEWLQDHLRNR